MQTGRPGAASIRESAATIRDALNPRAAFRVVEQHVGAAVAVEIRREEAPATGPGRAVVLERPVGSAERLQHGAAVVVVEQDIRAPIAVQVGQRRLPGRGAVGIAGVLVVCGRLERRRRLSRLRRTRCSLAGATRLGEVPCASRGVRERPRHETLEVRGRVA